MNDATNDATEFESSLDGAISFFQNLRRKLGALEQDASTQHDRLRAITTSVAKLEQNQQIVALESQLAEQARELRNLLASVQILTQDARTLRDHAAGHESRLEQHHGQIGRLEAAVQANQEQLGQFGGIAETQYQHLHRLESALGAIDQNTRTLGQVVDSLKITLDQHDHTLDTLCQTVEAHETAQHQHHAQQAQLDGFAESLDDYRQESQILQKSLARLQDEFETQRRASNEVNQIRRDLQKQQDRLKHLETLIGKVSADTNSTRQILNILQSDLITQSDTLRELDQHWQTILAAYQPPVHSPETPVAGTPVPTAASGEHSDSPAAPGEHSDSPAASSVPTPNAAADQSLAALAVETERLEQEIHQALSVVQDGLMGQDERFTELRSTIQDQLNLHWERLGQLETALDQLQEIPAVVPNLDSLRDSIAAQAETLRQLQDSIPRQLQEQQERLGQLETALAQLQQIASEPATDADLNAFRNTLTAQAETLRQFQGSIQEQLQEQQERLGQLETALAHLREIPAVAPDLDPLRDTLAAQAEALRELRETTRQQATTLTQTLELQQSDIRETTAAVEDLQQEFEELRQALPRLDSALEQQQQCAEADHRQGLEFQRALASLQHATTTLEERLNGQAQAFSGNFEQFRALASDIRNLQQQVSALESVPQRLNALEEDLIGREQYLPQLRDTVRQLQEDSQQISTALQQTDPGARAGELETRLNEQQQQFLQLNEAIDNIRTDAKITQEKVITMATNVAKRIFEFQNQLTATETAHAERLQEAEQKLIQLQAALEIMETQRKGRRWLSMPAMFSQILLTAGAAFLGVLVTVIWTTI